MLTNLLCIASMVAAIAYCQSSTVDSRSVASRRRAFIVGNDHYGSHPLSNAINDAQGMKEALVASGYSVTLVKDTTLRDLDTALQSFLDATQPGDVVVVFYAGHGFQIDGENYFVPTDFSASDASTAKVRAIPMSRVPESLTAHHAHMGLFIADACRDNPFDTSRGLRTGLAAMSSSAGMYIAFSTSPNGVASDSPKQGHGLFSRILLETLAKPLTNLDEIFGLVRNRVYTESGGKQTVWTESALVDPAIFRSIEQREIGQPLEAYEVRGVAAEVAQRPGLSPAPAFLTTPNTPNRSVGAGSPGTDLADSSLEVQEIADSVYESLKNGSVRDADAILQANSSVGSDDVGILDLCRAQVLMSQGHPSNALEFINTAIQKRPFDPFPFYVRSLAYSLLGQYPAAFRDIAAVLATRPTDILCATVKANLLFVTGQYAEAILVCTDIISRDSRRAPVYLIKGNCERALGNQQAAAVDFATAARLQISAK